MLDMSWFIDVDEYRVTHFHQRASQKNDNGEPYKVIKIVYFPLINGLYIMNFFKIQ